MREDLLHWVHAHVRIKPGHPLAHRQGKACGVTLPSRAGSRLHYRDGRVERTA